MLYRKIEQVIEKHLTSNSNKILIVEGARQVGKTFIIREVGKKLFKNYIEINLVDDLNTRKIFSSIESLEDFYFKLSLVSKSTLGAKEDTLVFLDEIQAYPHLLTFLKFLKEDDRFTYICSGSLLGIALHESTSIPIGSTTIIKMYPLDFEEFLIANNISSSYVQHMRKKYKSLEPLSEEEHNLIMNKFKLFLIVGGLPDAVNTYLSTTSIKEVRSVQKQIFSYYQADAMKYEVLNNKKLRIKTIYSSLVSNMENKKKRVIFKDIEGLQGKRYSSYLEEFDYLTYSGIALEVNAISNPKFPLKQSVSKNLLKLYYNDVGILTEELYGLSSLAILQDENSVNLGSVYESVVASELKCHNHELFYYDNKSKGEVDFLINDYSSNSVVPIEVKSGKDYSIHSALNNLISTDDYDVKKAYVLSNTRDIKVKNNKIIYIPIYYIMFFDALEVE